MEHTSAKLKIDCILQLVSFRGAAILECTSQQHRYDNQRCSGEAQSLSCRASSFLTPIIDKYFQLGQDSLNSKALKWVMFGKKPLII